MHQNLIKYSERVFFLYFIQKPSKIVIQVKRILIKNAIKIISLPNTLKFNFKKILILKSLSLYQ